MQLVLVVSQRRGVRFSGGGGTIAFGVQHGRRVANGSRANHKLLGGWFVQEGTGSFVGRQQCLDFLAQLGVPAAHFVQVSGSRHGVG
jgi:hypothetical protein